MIKFISLFLVFAALHGAHAAPPPPVESALLFERIAKANGGVSESVELFTDGRLVQTMTSPQIQGGSSTLEVTVVPFDYISRIHHLANHALPVRPGRHVVNVRCPAPSSHTETFTAVGRRIFLRRGTVCDGGFDYNRQPSGIQLAEALQFLVQASRERMSRAAIEAGLDRTLAVVPRR